MDTGKELRKLSFTSRCLFIASNFAYLLCAMLMYYREESIKTSPVDNQVFGLSLLSEVCSVKAVNFISVAVISVISSIFHTKQVFGNGSASSCASCTRWNTVDLTCASSYGLFLSICFFKRSLIFFIPAISLLVLGAVAKLSGYPHLYMLLHGLWHVASAAFFMTIVCGES